MTLCNSEMSHKTEYKPWVSIKLNFNQDKIMSDRIYEISEEYNNKARTFSFNKYKHFKLNCISSHFKKKFFFFSDAVFNIC